MQHRGGGARGGTGETGGHKHGWTYTVVYEPDRFGKNGFKRAWVPTSSTLNAGELDQLAEELTERKLATREEDGIHIDLGAMGVDKLLGGGRIGMPLVVKVASFSEVAKRKIEEAKGRIESKN